MTASQLALPNRPTRGQFVFAASAVVVLGALIAVLLAKIPPVVGLGDKVKLPIYHGASTWVDLVLFTLMALVAIAFVVTRRDRLYAWEVGLRSIAAPLWLINSVLGFIAALSTWDFTGTKESPFVLVQQDPRLMAQGVLLLGVGVLVVLHWLVLDKRSHKAIADVGFVVVMWAMLANIFLDPAKRALHPDSPVLHSGWEIKGPFFGILLAIFLMGIVLAWVVSLYVGPEAAESPAPCAEPCAEGA